MDGDKELLVGGRVAEEEKETDRGEGRQQGRHNLRRRTNRETRGETDGWGAGKAGRGAYKGSSWLQVAWWGYRRIEAAAA